MLHGTVFALCDRVFTVQGGLMKLLLEASEKQGPDGMAVLLR